MMKAPKNSGSVSNASNTCSVSHDDDYNDGVDSVAIFVENQLLVQKKTSREIHKFRIVYITLFILVSLVSIISLSLFAARSKNSKPIVAAASVQSNTDTSNADTESANSTDSKIQTREYQYSSTWINTSQTESFPLLINCGGYAFQQNASNLAWVGDQYYNGGRPIRRICSSTMYVSNTNDMLCSVRIFGDTSPIDFDDSNNNLTSNTISSSYNIPIPIAGSYSITLGFIEYELTQPQQRIFDVVVEGSVILENLDIFSEAGGTLKPFSTNATDIVIIDGFLTIELIPKVNLPVIATVEVRLVPAKIESSSSQNVQPPSSYMPPNAQPSSMDVVATQAVSSYPTTVDTILPTIITDAPTETVATYEPGRLTRNENGLTLSTGLTARLVATSGRRVQYIDGNRSSIDFHDLPDGAATFVDERSWNIGGWIYVSNSELDREWIGSSGVDAITFDRDGNAIDYRNLLSGTTANCGGGRTPWNTWVSCEEYENGQIYQVDPEGNRPSERLTMGRNSPGYFESFAYDVRDRDAPSFFATKDDGDGELTKFTPYFPDWDDPWTMLHGDGRIEYLVLEPDTRSSGTYYWSSSRSDGRDSAARYFPNGEGIDVYEDRMYFISKEVYTLFIFQLDGNTYTSYSTQDGLFQGEPDQLVRITGANDGLLYFTEDGGDYAGVHARDENGNFFTILESYRYEDEVTGLSFDPSGIHMYVAYQKDGLLFDITRTDGLPFHANVLNVRYHRKQSVS